MTKAFKTAAALFSALCAAALASCGADVAEIDLGALSSELLEAGIFSEELSGVSQSIAEKRLGLDSSLIAECVAASGTKAVVDEFALIRLSSPDAKDSVEKGIAEHIASQKSNYSSYKPDEVPKLEDYVLVSSGDYEIFVVSGDSSAAEEIIKKYTK